MLTPAKPIAGMVPWCCQYWQGGAVYAIVLYATDPDQIERDHRKTLDRLTVVGRLIGSIDA